MFEDPRSSAAASSFGELYQKKECILIANRINENSEVPFPVIPFSRGSSQPRDWTQSSTLQADTLPSEPPKNTRFYQIESSDFGSQKNKSKNDLIICWHLNYNLDVEKHCPSEITNKCEECQVQRQEWDWSIQQQKWRPEFIEQHIFTLFLRYSYYRTSFYI